VSSGFALPDGFRFGVATAGFQTEGGYNQPGQPANNWAGWERAGRADVSGSAVQFWDRYEEHVDRATSAGCDAFRFSVEWARCEPSEGELDDTAIARYRDILAACHDRGVLPLVTLHHFTHPHWLGEEFWLRRDAPERFASWVDTVIPLLADQCRDWVTINEINILAVSTWMLGAFPPGGQLRTGKTVRMLDNLVAAHVLAYNAIKRHQVDSVVSTNNYSMVAYELDRMLLDLLVARRAGIGRHDVGAWLHEQRAGYHDAIRPRLLRDRAVRRASKSAIPLARGTPRTIAAVYDSPHECTLDVTQIDYYAPYVGGSLQVPGRATAGGRNWEPGRRLWDDPVEPTGLPRFAAENVVEGLPLWIVENGLCNRVTSERAWPRRDGWDRVRHLTAHLGQVADAITQGIPITAYFHWTLCDNYEWGSFEERFGLYGVDRSGPTPRILDTDSMGGDAAGTYRRLIEQLRAGERPRDPN
jgi:beta-glucosidase